MAERTTQFKDSSWDFGGQTLGLELGLRMLDLVWELTALDLGFSLGLRGFLGSGGKL